MKTKDGRGPDCCRANAAADSRLEQAKALDGDASRRARGRGAVDLALGELLTVLFRGDRLLRLGFARRVDYARERLGVPARTMYAWLQLAAAVEGRPLLRHAVRHGLLPPRHAVLVSPLATGASEAAWVALATTRTYAELERHVRAEGADPPGPDDTVFEVESLVLAMTPEQQDRLDAALAWAREVVGPAVPEWAHLEALAQEWLGSYGAFAPPELPHAAEPHAAGLRDRRPARAEVPVHPSRADRASEGPADEADPSRAPRDTSPGALDAEIVRLLAERRGFDGAFGPLVRRIVDERVWRTLGYASLDAYCRARLGVCARSIRQRVWLERKMDGLPELREALRAGTISFAKALLVAQDATPADVADRIAKAAATTWQQTARESGAEEKRKNRARGRRRLWGPTDANETIAVAIASARALALQGGRAITPGEALACIADHFRIVWSEHDRLCDGESGRRMRERREVLGRCGGLCAVPGCSRAAVHDHHIVFRSQGGSDELRNRTGLCAAHHLRGVHGGRLKVVGCAGERLLWSVEGDGDAFGLWVTEGEDDLRRVG